MLQNILITVSLSMKALLTYDIHISKSITSHAIIVWTRYTYTENVLLPFSWCTDLWLSVTSFTEAEQLEYDSLGSSGEDPHAVLQLLISPLKKAVQGPQVLYSQHVQEVILGKPSVKSLKFICNNRKGDLSVLTLLQCMCPRRSFN